MIDREEVLRELREARLRQRMHGHDWDIADVMEVLDNLGVFEYQGPMAD